jgi:hypothetical protein
MTIRRHDGSKAFNVDTKALQFSSFLPVTRIVALSPLPARFNMRSSWTGCMFYVFGIFSHHNMIGKKIQIHPD